MRCKRCGAMNPDWSPDLPPTMKQFCGYCGAELEPMPESGTPLGRQNASAGGAPTPPITPPPPFSPEPPKSAGKPKKSGRGWKIALIIAAVVIAGLAVAFFTVHIWEPATCTEPETC